MLPFDTTKFTTSFAFLFCYLEHDKNRYKMTNWWLKKSILFNAFTQYVHPKQKLQSCNSRCIHNTTPDVPDAKSFCKLLAKGKFQLQTTHKQVKGSPEGQQGMQRQETPRKLKLCTPFTFTHSLLTSPSSSCVPVWVLTFHPWALMPG